MTDDDPIVVFIARQPDLHRRLIAEHVDDGTGHCRSCPIGNSAGYKTYPCNIACYVIRASRVRPLDLSLFAPPSPAAPDPAVVRLPEAPRPRAPRVVRAGATQRADGQRTRRPGTGRK